MKNIRALLFLVFSFASFWASAQGTQTIVILPATGFTGTPYQVSFTRSLGDFPFGDAGKAAAKRAVIDGRLRLTVISSGTYSGTTYTPNKFYSSCVIAAGTKPGVNPPNCSFTTTVVTPPTTTTTVISIPAVNQSFAAADGSGTGSDIGLGYYGPLTDNTQYRQFNYSAPVTAANYSLSIHYKTNTQSTGKGNILINGSQNVEFDLEGAEGGTRTTNRTIALNSGANTIRMEGKSGTTYFFDNVTLTRPSSTSVVTTPGSTTTTTPTTPTTDPVVTNPTSGSVDSQGFLVYDDQGWTGADEKVIRGNGMQMRFKRTVGACPTWLSLDSDNENVIDDAQVGPAGAKFSDKGVQVQLSWYSHPAGGNLYTTDGRTIGGTGANPVQGGNTNPYFVASPVEKSAIINDPVRGQVFCSRTRSLLWDWPNTPGHGTVDLEYWTQPNKVVAYRARVNVEERPSGTPEQRKWTALSQEFLCFYGKADLNDHFVDINGSEYNMRSGVGLDRQSNDFFTSGCYIGIYAPGRSSGMMYYTPRNAIFKSWQKTSEQGKWYDDASAYVNASSKWNMDIVGHYVDNGYFILGSKAEAMAAKAQLEPIDQSFDFDFTNTNNTWWNEDARLMRESNGLLKWYVGDVNHDVNTINTGKMLSPVRAWQASQFQNIEFTMAVSGTTQLNLKWGKPGQFGQVEFRTPITVTGDGTERTYQFNLSNLQNWNGTISYIGLEANLNTNNPNAYIILRRARKFDLGGFGALLLLSIGVGQLRRNRSRDRGPIRKAVTTKIKSRTV